MFQMPPTNLPTTAVTMTLGLYEGLGLGYTSVAPGKSKSPKLPRPSLSPVCRNESKSNDSSAPASSGKLRPRSKPLGCCHVSEWTETRSKEETHIRINASKWLTTTVVHRLVSRRWWLHGLLWLAVLSLVEGLLVDWRDWGHGSRGRRRGRLFAVCRCWGCTCIWPFLVCGLLQSTSMLLRGGAGIRNFTLLSFVGFFFGLALLV